MAANQVDPEVAMRYADSQNELRLKLKDLARDRNLEMLEDSTLSFE